MRWLVALAVSCGRAETPPPTQAGADPIVLPPASAAKPNAADPIWVRFGKPLPSDFLTCTSDANCDVAMGIPIACWPIAVNKAHRPIVEAQLHERIERGESCAHPGCGIEFHEAVCKRHECTLIDGCQDPGGSR